MHGSSSCADHASSTTSPSSPDSILTRNPQLSRALTAALAKSGVTILADTCQPFKTLGQSIAALHINHKFPSCSLSDLSAAKNLGADIQVCRQEADAKAEARSATKQAKRDIKDANW